jgi:hypothetical protein
MRQGYIEMHSAQEAEPSRDQAKQKRLAEWAKLGLAPTWRAAIELSHGGSIACGPFASEQAAERQAEALKAKYNFSPEVAGAEVTWHGAEPEKPRVRE